YYTFSAHDAGCAVSRRVLEIMRTERLLERAATIGARLRTRLEEVLGGHPLVSDIRGLGLMQGVELVADRSSGQPFARSVEFAARVAGAALERDLWVYPAGSGPVSDAILLGPPYTIGEDHVELIVQTLREAIDAAAGALLSAAG
ncbi:MAG: aspartate aminotransferase family protein, partial [Burkholderiales bacterium]